MDRIRPTRDAAAAPSHVARLAESVADYGVDGTLRLLHVGLEADAQNRARRAVSAAMTALDRLHEARATAHIDTRAVGRDPAADLGIPPEELLDSPAAPTSAGGRSPARDLGIPPDDLVPLERLREGTFETPSGDAYYQDGDTLRDAMDLLAVTDELHSTGSPNLENDQARVLVRSLQQHGLLSGSDRETLRKLVAKYQDQIDQLRQSPDRQGQDYLDVSDGSRARLPLDELLADDDTADDGNANQA